MKSLAAMPGFFSALSWPGVPAMTKSAVKNSEAIERTD